MNRQYIEDNDIIGSYLSGALSEDEASRFELAFFADPELARLVEIEQALRARCRDEAVTERGRGRAADAPAHRAPRWQALAAGIGVLALALIPGAWFAQRLGAAQAHIARLEGQLDALRAPGIPIVPPTLAPLRSAATGTPPRIAIALPAPTQRVVVGLRVPDGVVAGRDLRVQVRGPGQPPRELAVGDAAGEVIDVVLPGAMLMPGVVELVLSRAQTGQVLGTYALLVTD